MVPVGVIVDVSAVVLGSILGPVVGKVMPKKLKDDLTVMFGFIAAMLAIVSLIKVRNSGAVALCCVISFSIGTILDFDGNLKKGIGVICRRMIPSASPEKAGLLSIYVVLFAFSATGIMGAIESAGGDHQLLVCKGILDFVVAMIISCEIGRVTGLAAVVQAVVLLLCFYASSFLSSLLVGETYGDLCAVGGIMLLMVAFNMMKVVKTYPLNGVLGFILIVPISLLWQSIF